MALEIERRFLVPDPSRVPLTQGRALKQGYVAVEGMAVRVRIDGEKAFLTLKSAGPQGASRAEFEYPIPMADAEDLIANHARFGVLTKTRYELPLPDGRKWEVDVFDAPLAPLCIAEIELRDAGEPVDLPSWLGPEITHDKRYSNAALATALRRPDGAPLTAPSS